MEQNMDKNVNCSKKLMIERARGQKVEKSDIARACPSRKNSARACPSIKNFSVKKTCSCSFPIPAYNLLNSTKNI